MQLQYNIRSFEGHRIYASRKVAEKIEKQTRYVAELYNVDVRQDQRYMAGHDIFLCGDRDESRFSPDFEVPLSIMGMDVVEDPNILKLGRYTGDNLDELGGADVREPAIHRGASRQKYSRRFAEASAVKAHMKQGLPLAPGMKIGYVISDAHCWIMMSSL